MAALGGDTGRLQARGPGAGHHDLAQRSRRAADEMRHGRLAPRGGILDAERIGADIDPVEAIAGAHALADVVETALHQLAHDMGVGDMAAGHADHVAMAFLDGARGGGEILDVVGVEDRQIGDLLRGAGEIEELRRRKTHVRHVHRQGGMGEDGLPLPPHS